MFFILSRTSRNWNISGLKKTLVSIPLVHSKLTSNSSQIPTKLISKLPQRYRKIVLRALPKLIKLDNVEVTPEEVSDALRGPALDAGPPQQQHQPKEEVYEEDYETAYRQQAAQSSFRGHSPVREVSTCGKLTRWPKVCLTKSFSLPFKLNKTIKKIISTFNETNFNKFCDRSPCVAAAAAANAAQSRRKWVRVHQRSDRSSVERSVVTSAGIFAHNHTHTLDSIMFTANHTFCMFFVRFLRVNFALPHILMIFLSMYCSDHRLIITIKTVIRPQSPWITRHHRASKTNVISSRMRWVGEVTGSEEQDCGKNFENLSKSFQSSKWKNRNFLCSKAKIAHKLRSNFVKI